MEIGEIVRHVLLGICCGSIPKAVWPQKEHSKERFGLMLIILGILLSRIDSLWRWG